jgi:hypothetical protein
VHFGEKVLHIEQRSQLHSAPARKLNRYRGQRHQHARNAHAGPPHNVGRDYYHTLATTTPPMPLQGRAPPAK